MKKENGITLVALIITIIVMAILAGVIIITAVMDGGVIDRAKESIVETERAKIEEIIKTSYVYKKMASQNTVLSLDMPKTAESIFKNLTNANYKLKTSEGEDVTKVEDIYDSETEKINLNIEGNSGEYTGIVNKNGLQDSIKVKKDEEVENIPDDTTSVLPEETVPVEENYLTLSTDADGIFTSDFLSIYGNMGTTQVANLAKLVYRSGEDSLEIVNNRTDTFGSTYLVEVKYYKDNELISSYILRKSGGYSFNDDGTSSACHGYPHYSTGWTDKTIVTGTCSECNGNIYGVLSEFPKFTGDWEIDLESSNDYGKQYLSNVLVEE